MQDPERSSLASQTETETGTGMEGAGDQGGVDPANDRFPNCLVWTPIPVLTWVLPFVGHLGIADSKGVTWDFAGPYHISRGDLAA